MASTRLGWLVGAGLVAGFAGVAGAQDAVPSPPTEASPSPPRAAVELGSVETLRTACLATRPAARVLHDGDAARAAFAEERTATLERLFHVTVPAGGFRFTGSTELRLDTSRPIHALRGALTLWIPSDTRLVLASDPETAAKLMDAVQAGTAVLDLWFELDDRGGAPCSGSLATEVYVVAADPAAVVVRDGLGATLARADTALADRHRAIIGGYSGVPAAVIGALTAQGGVDSRALAARLRTISEPMRICYTRRLTEDSGVGGTMVVGVEVGEDGKVGGVAFTVDGVKDDVLRQCLDEAVRRVSFAGVPGLPTLFQASVELKLVPRPVAK